MKKSLIVAAALAAMTFGAANVASAGVAGTILAGISTHADTQITDQVAYRKNWRHRHWRKSHHRKHWVCKWRHHRKHCYWR
jgi:hypothetical protein